MTYTKATTASFSQRIAGLLSALIIGLLLSACQMPSYSPPGGSSGPSGSSGGGGGASGGGGSSGGGSSGGGSSGGGASGGGMPGGEMPGGEMPGGEMPGGGMPGGSQPGEQSGGQSGDPQGADGSGSAGSAGDGQSVEDLDKALDDSLDGFDDAVGGSGKGTSEIDILSPSGSTGMENNSDEPLFEEGSEGGMAEANAELEKRAAEGSGEGSDGAESSDGAEGAEGSEGSEGSQSEGGKTQGQDSGGSAGAEGSQGEALPIPEDIDDGQGDDIVERQIRDAAMKETDPVLRERLWDEYRRIKNQ